VELFRIYVTNRKNLGQGLGEREFEVYHDMRELSNRMEN
jgi:hypothetical protein